jgi:hypothetical protein
MCCVEKDVITSCLLILLKCTFHMSGIFEYFRLAAAEYEVKQRQYYEIVYDTRCYVYKITARSSRSAGRTLLKTKGDAFREIKTSETTCSLVDYTRRDASTQKNYLLPDKTIPFVWN